MSISRPHLHRRSARNRTPNGQVAASTRHRPRGHDRLRCPGTGPLSPTSNHRSKGQILKYVLGLVTPENQLLKHPLVCSVQQVNRLIFSAFFSNATSEHFTLTLGPFPPTFWNTMMRSCPTIVVPDLVVPCGEYVCSHVNRRNERDSIPITNTEALSRCCSQRGQRQHTQEQTEDSQRTHTPSF